MPLNNAGLDLDPAELLKTVVGSAPIVLFALDCDGIFTLSEGRGLDALGLKPGEVVGKSLFDVYKGNAMIADSCRRALKGETVTTIVPVQGLAFETRWSPRLDWGGKVTGVFGVATDITEPYRCLLAKDEFLSVISHELRTPLSSATGWASLLRDETLSSRETQKAVEVVCRNLADIQRLIGELRDASRATTGALRLKIRRTSLNAAVRAAAKSLASAAQAKNLTLKISVPALTGAADKARLRQIAWILMSNAVKYSPSGSTITVSLERDEDDAVLRVTDEGPGLPPELRSQLFAPANLPASELPPRGRGLGLGLVIARRLAELHGGTLEVSDGAGTGSVFTLRLPLAR